MWHLRQIFIACSQLLNTLLGGWADESLCSRSYRWRRDGVRTWPCKVIDAVAFWDKEARAVNLERLDVHDKRWVRHCELSYESERCGRHLPPEMR